MTEIIITTIIGLLVLAVIAFIFAGILAIIEYVNFKVLFSKHKWELIGAIITLLLGWGIGKIVIIFFLSK